jgi:hypothetical protein
VVQRYLNYYDTRCLKKIRTNYANAESRGPTAARHDGFKGNI